MRTPVTVVTGFLGVGKTTLIRHLLASHGTDERWAVLVNEFGEVGIDGAILGGESLSVREIPGGCICCSAGLALQTALVRLLREVAPTRLLIEPTGLAHPASVLDTLRQPGIDEAVVPRATLTLVDPRHLSRPRIRDSATWQDQVTVADVLVATKTDLCAPEDLDAFRAFAAARWPPPVAVAEVVEGALDPRFLDLDPGPPRPLRREGHVHEHGAPTALDGPGRAAHVTADAATCGWIWPYERVWDRLALREALQELVVPGGPLPVGLLRLKGLFRTPRATLLVQADTEQIRMEPIGWRRDSRVEIIAPPEPRPDWDAVEARLEQALRQGAP